MNAIAEELDASLDLAPALTHLDWLESEAIHIMREVVAETKNPALLFSGGKDSIVMLRIAEKAFRPDRFPFPLVHIDTGHNFPEVIAFRDARVAELGERLVVGSVEESIRSGRVRLRRPDESRNPHQTVTLLARRGTRSPRGSCVPCRCAAAGTGSGRAGTLSRPGAA